MALAFAGGVFPNIFEHFAARKSSSRRTNSSCTPQDRLGQVSHLPILLRNEVGFWSILAEYFLRHAFHPMFTGLRSGLATARMFANPAEPRRSRSGCSLLES